MLADNLASGHIATLPATANASGSAALALPLVESLPPFVAYFQWFHVDVGANPRNLSSTLRMRVGFAK